MFENVRIGSAIYKYENIYIIVRIVNCVRIKKKKKKTYLI